MDCDSYQIQAHRTAAMTMPPGSHRHMLMGVIGLCGETGELADMIKKHVFHGHPMDYAKLGEELGDVLWYIAETATAFGLDLSAIAKGNIKKLSNRYPSGFTSERSINRTNWNPLEVGEKGQE